MEKLLSLLLAAMLLILPAASFAETDLGVIGGADGPTEIVLSADSLTAEALAAGRRVTTNMTFTEFTGLETGDAMTDAAIADLFAALGLVVAQQGDEVEMAVQFSGQDALTLGFAEVGEDLYLKSNLIGGTVVVKAQELEPLVNRLIDMLVLMEGITEEDAASLREEVSSMMDAYASAFESGMNSALTEEDLENLNMTAIEQLVSFAQSKAEPVTEIVVPRMCDPAVSGEKAVLTNEDMAAACKYLYQFLLDNPKLLNYLGSSMGYPTEEEIALQWKTAGELYMAFNIYESEEAFRADQQTFEQVVRTAMAEVDARKLIDGEFVVTAYYDEAGLPVYMTMSLPLFIQEQTVVEVTDAAAAKGETTNINVTYTRQTVADGVAHGCNIDVDGEIITIDAHVNERGVNLRLADTDTEGETWRVEVATELSDSETDEGMQLLVAEVTIYDNEERVVGHFLLDGACRMVETQNYLSGKLTMTINEYADDVIEVADAETGTVEVIDSPDAEPTQTVIVLEFTSDTQINGVDFTSTTSFAIEAEGVRMAIQAVSATSDPQESILSGDVVRPAELDDAAFSNWFVGVVNAVSSWMSTALMTLPESVLTLILSATMM